jgi:hypothetical protein
MPSFHCLVACSVPSTNIDPPPHSLHLQQRHVQIDFTFECAFNGFLFTLDGKVDDSNLRCFMVVIEECRLQAVISRILHRHSPAADAFASSLRLLMKF